MPFALVLVGLALVITSAQDTYVQLGRQVRSDFTGNGSFIYWAGAIGMAGAIGYVEQLRRLSIALMSLVLMVLLLKHSDFFSKFSAGIAAKPTAPNKPATNEPAIGKTAEHSAKTLGDWVTSFGTSDIQTTIEKAGKDAGSFSWWQNVLPFLMP